MIADWNGMKRANSIMPNTRYVAGEAPFGEDVAVNATAASSDQNAGTTICIEVHEIAEDHVMYRRRRCWIRTQALIQEANVGDVGRAKIIAASDCRVDGVDEG